jgi:Protein of unknown function (DUF2568)
MTEPSSDRRRWALRATALGIRFALELCVLASLATLAAHLPAPILVQVLLGLLFCGSGAALWGAFLSPKRKYEVGAAGRLVLEAGFFAGSALILNCVGWPALAIALVVTAAADRIALALSSPNFNQ